MPTTGALLLPGFSEKLALKLPLALADDAVLPWGAPELEAGVLKADDVGMTEADD